MGTLQLVEPIPIEDDLCTGLGLIEDLDCCARFVLFARQTMYETGEVIYVVKRKIILPYEAIVPGIEMATTFLARRALTMAAGKVRALVRQ